MIPASYSLLSLSRLSSFSFSISSSLLSLFLSCLTSSWKASDLLSNSFFSSFNILIDILSLVIFGFLVRNCDFPFIVDTDWEDLKISRNSGLTLIAKLLDCNSYSLRFSSHIFIYFWNSFGIKELTTFHSHSRLGSFKYS